jgi:hypothetical protein
MGLGGVKVGRGNKGERVSREGARGKGEVEKGEGARWKKISVRCKARDKWHGVGKGDVGKVLK